MDRGEIQKKMIKLARKGLHRTVSSDLQFCCYFLLMVKLLI